MKAERQRQGIAGVIVHQTHYICDCRWTCTDDLFCFLNTLRGGSSGVGPDRPGGLAVVGETPPSPLGLSTVPLLLGSVRLRRMLPPTDCTGLPGASATGESPSLVNPSVRTPCIPCFWFVALLLTILVGWGFPGRFQLPPCVSSSKDKIVSSSSSAPTIPAPVTGGG